LAFGLVHTGTILITGATGSVFAAVLWALAHRISASALAILIATLTGRHSTRSDAGNRNVAGRSALALGGLFTFFWLRTTMRELTLWEPTTKLVRELFALSFEVGSLGVSVGSVATLALGGVLAVYGARIVRSVLEEDVLPRTKLGVGTRLATSTSAYYGLLVVGVLLAAGASGVELQKLTVIVGALSVGVGFGLQNIVQNFVAGLILIFGRPVNVEDRIQLGELTGIVTRIGFRASIVRTFDGADVIVPNADLISMQVVNWTLSDPTRRMQINVGVAYGSDVQQVMKLLLGVARENPDVITEPPPDVLFLEHGSSSLDFRLRAWTQQSMNWPNVKSDLTAGINVALRDAGVEIPFPQRDVHIRSVVPKATSPDEEVSSSQGALNRSDSER
jgi:small-conductance mechanosensitive channel